MIIIKFLQMPTSIKGAVRKNPDGTNTILLNSKHSYEQNVKTFTHELSHIINDDISKQDLNEVERRFIDGQENELYDQWDRLLSYP